MTDLREHDVLKAMQGLAEAVVIAGVDMRIRFWNRSAEKMFGFAPDEVLGELVTLIVPDRHHHHHHHGSAAAPTIRIRTVGFMGLWRNEVHDSASVV